MTLLELIDQWRVRFEARYKDADGNGGYTTKLNNPIENNTSPLVQVATTDSAGLLRLYKLWEAFQLNLYIQTAEGEQLDLIAGYVGAERRLDQPSIVPVIFRGVPGTVVPSSTALVDGGGNEWLTKETAQIGESGLAFVNACSEPGYFYLDAGELYLSNELDGVDSGTNSALAELGGAYEEDEVFRRRLLARGPRWRVAETVDAALNAAYDAGALRAVNTTHPCSGLPMIAVMGGDLDAIADAIYRAAPFSVDRLDGDYTAGSCPTFKLQVMCPVLIHVRLWRECKCEPEEIETGVANVVAKAQKLALYNSSVNVSELICSSRMWLKSEIRYERGPLYGECTSLTTTNPADGSTVAFGGSKIDSVCCAEACPGDWDSAVVLNPWEYPVLLEENITVMDECLTGKKCCAC